MSYRTIIKAACTIALRYPTLLVAGFLVALIVGWGASSALNQLGESLVMDLPTQIASGRIPLRSLATNIITTFNTKPVQATLSVLIPLSIIIFFILIAILAQGYLTLGTGAAVQGWFQRNVVWRRTKSRLTSLIGLAVLGQIISKGFLALITFISFVLIGARTPEMGQIVFLVVFFVLGLPLGLAVSALTKVASVFLLVDKRSLSASLGGAIRLLLEHWLAAVEFIIVLFGLTIATGIVSVLTALLISTPSILISIIAANSKAIGTAHFFEVIAVALTILVFLLGGTMISTTLTNSWTVFTLTARDGGISSWLKEKFQR